MAKKFLPPQTGPDEAEAPHEYHTLIRRHCGNAEKRQKDLSALQERTGSAKGEALSDREVQFLWKGNPAQKKSCVESSPLSIFECAS